MLVIGKGQLDQLRQATKLRYEDEMIVHLAGFSPRLFKTLEEVQQRGVVRFGMDRAEAHGFTFRGPVRLYLELTLLFGSHFDTDPQYPWAGQVLAEQEEPELLQMDRAELLYQKAMEYQEQVSGPDDVHAIEALHNIRKFTQLPLTMSLDTFLQDMVLEVVRMYPKKAIYLGRERLEMVLRQGMDKAKDLHVLTVRGAVLVSLLMLTFGHGCTEDPLYPWIAATLSKNPQADPEVRGNHLEKKVMIWLDHVLASFGVKESA